jgi:ribokinase
LNTSLQPSVWVVGSTMVDLVAYVDRLPTRGETVVGRTFALGFGGKGANQAVMASRFGARVSIVNCLGLDVFGDMTLENFEREGIDVTHVTRTAEAASGVAPIWVEPDGANRIIVVPGANEQLRPENAARAVAEADTVDVVLGQLEIAQDVTAAAFAAGRERGALTLLNPAPAAILDPTLLASTDWLVPNEVEAGVLAPRLSDLAALGPRVVVTLGERGAALLGGAGESLEIPAERVDAVDTTGAGDAFLGGLHAGLHQGLGWDDAARLGNAAGAACVERMGAFPADAAWARRRALELYGGRPFAMRETPPDPTGAAMLDALDTMVRELGALRDRATASPYLAAVALIRNAEAQGCRVHVTGIGKPEHLARYGASILSSTGTPTAFLHATETIHGSAGQILPGDVVIAISNSGATQELLLAVGALRALGAKLVAITGDPVSALAKEADVVLEARVEREGGGLGLAPRASIAAELLVLATLSAGLEVARGFTREDYHARHPAGRLGDLSKGKR